MTENANSLDTPLHELFGRKWKAVFNGKRATNGEPYSATYTGRIEDADENGTIYDTLRDLACYLESANADMEKPDSYQVTLFPFSSVRKEHEKSNS